MQWSTLATGTSQTLCCLTTSTHHRQPAPRVNISRSSSRLGRAEKACRPAPEQQQQRWSRQPPEGVPLPTARHGLAPSPFPTAQHGTVGTLPSTIAAAGAPPAHTRAQAGSMCRGRSWPTLPPPSMGAGGGRMAVTPSLWPRPPCPPQQPNPVLPGHHRSSPPYLTFPFVNPLVPNNLEPWT